MDKQCMQEVRARIDRIKFVLEPLEAEINKAHAAAVALSILAAGNSEESEAEEIQASIDEIKSHIDDAADEARHFLFRCTAEGTTSFAHNRRKGRKR